MSKKAQPQKGEQPKPPLNVIDEENEPFLKALQKKARNLTRKLTEISELQNKQNLKVEQIEKVNRKEGLILEKQELEKFVNLYRDTIQENAQYYRNNQLKELENLAKALAIHHSHGQFPEVAKLNQLWAALSSSQTGGLMQHVEFITVALINFANDAKLHKAINTHLDHSNAHTHTSDNVKVQTAEIIQENKQEKKVEETKKEQLKKEEPKKEQPKKEEPRKEQPKKEEPKEPNREEPKKQQPKKEEPKKEELKKEEPKQEVPVEQVEAKQETKVEAPKKIVYEQKKSQVDVQKSKVNQTVPLQAAQNGNEKETNGSNQQYQKRKYNDRERNDTYRRYDRPRYDEKLNCEYDNRPYNQEPKPYNQQPKKKYALKENKEKEEKRQGSSDSDSSLEAGYAKPFSKVEIHKLENEGFTVIQLKQKPRDKEAIQDYNKQHGLGKGRGYDRQYRH